MRTFGPGSVVDLPDDSVMPMGLEHWPPAKDRDKIEEPRLQEALGVAYFRSPPPWSEYSSDRGEKIPVRKFPRTHFCPECNLLTRNYDDMYLREDHVKCPECGDVRMTPARFIAACEAGHAEDFPFHRWLHRGEVPDDCWGRDLHLEHQGETTGLRDLLVVCEECGEARTMAGSFGEEALLSVGATCDGLHLWSEWGYGGEACDEPLRTMQRGASNFYFPETRSSISIPPWDSKASQLVSRYQTAYGEKPEPGESFAREALERMIEKQNLSGLTADDVFGWLEDVESDTRDEYDVQKFKLEEYLAFTRRIESSAEPPRFHVREGRVPDVLSDVVEQVVVAETLEEIRALYGFRRVEPRWGGEQDQGNLVELRHAGTDVAWLPAVRIRGEGFFLRFDTGALDAWAAGSHMGDRARELDRAVERHGGRGVNTPDRITPRFLFLHSFAHLVIKQLSLECGYSSGALRERVYPGDPSDGDEAHMAGVLIYTGSTDSEGTLGGLSRMAEPGSLGPVVRRAVENAAWCSSDPICSETKNTGERTQNLSACHACLFAPETSCEYLNSFLDRHAVVGNLEGDGGFLSSLVYGK